MYWLAPLTPTNPPDSARSLVVAAVGTAAIVVAALPCFLSNALLGLLPLLIPRSFGDIADSWGRICTAARLQSAVEATVRAWPTA